VSAWNTEMNNTPVSLSAPKTTGSKKGKVEELNVNGRWLKAN